MKSKKLLLIVLSGLLASASVGHSQTIQIGSQTGAQIFFDVTRSRTYNFGITTLGSTSGLSLSNVLVFVKRDAGVTDPVIVTIYNNFGGTGSVIATGTLAATNFSTSQFNGAYVPLNTNLVLGSGAYSVVLTSATSGNNQYFYKESTLNLTTNGVTLNSSLWVQDTNTTGLAGTSISASYVLADYQVSRTNVSFGNYRVGSTVSTNVVLTNTAFATTNNVSEQLSTVTTASNVATVAGLNTNLVAQGSTTNFTVGLSTANVGTNSGTVSLSYSSLTNGTASTRAGGATNVGSQTISVTGVGYRLATNAVSTTNVDLGKFRIVNGAGTGTVGITNTATADGYSEGLGVSNSATTGGATVTNIPGSLITAGSNNSVTVGLGSVVAGTNSGTVTLGFNSSGVGTSGFAATNIGSQVINVTGVGYRLATNVVSTTNVALGNFRIGASNVTSTVGVTNTAANDGYSEGLGVSNSATTGGATVTNIPGSLITASSNATITVGLGSVSAAGTNSGTVTLGFNSSGVGTSGFAATNIGTTNINVYAVGYRLASNAVSTTNVTLGNFRIVNGAGTGTVGITNTATADAYSEGLGVSNSATSGSATVTNIPGALIAAGGNGNVTVGLNTANAGTNSGTVTLGFNSSGVGTSGLSATNIGSQVINVSGVGYRLATNALNTTNVNLGNFRIVNGAGTGTVGITNTATADAYSEGLGVSNSATSGGATVTNIPGALIAAGGNNSLTVGLSTANAGTNSGTVTLGFNSSGVGTSGLAATNIGSQVINVSGVGYRLATNALNTTNVNLGNFRIVNGAGTGTVGITNTATADAYSEGLGVSNSATSGGATVTNIPGALIAAGGNGNVTVGLNTANAGTNSGTVTLGFNSSGVGTSGFAATNIGSQVINVSGVGYRLASNAVSTSSVNLGKFHIGYTTNNGSLSAAAGITNTATADGYSEGLAVANNGATGGATVGGIPAGLVAAGGRASIAVGLGSVSAVGANNGTVTLAFQSSGTGTSGLAATNIGSQVINVSAQGYSGQSVWSTDGGGSWNNFDNWDVPGGTPGVDGVLSINDTATFGSAIRTARTVSLNGQSPELALLSFSNASGSYTLAQGTGGSVAMGTTANVGVITNAAGIHSVSAAVSLARNTTAGVATNSKLALGAVNGTNSLAKTGAGTLSITGTGNLSGATTVETGTLVVNGSIASSDVTVQDGTLLGGSGTVGSTTIEAGGTINPGNSPGTLTIDGNLVWAAGANYDWQIYNASGTAGSTDGWDLLNITGALDLSSLSSGNKFNINMWSLASLYPDVNGDAIGFDNTQGYRWTIATAAGGISNFSADYFNLFVAANNRTSGFSNNLGGGLFALETQGNSLDIVFTPKKGPGPSPIPEPGTWAAAALVLGCAAFMRWRRRCC